MTIMIVGIDLGKNSCSIAGLDETGRVVLRRRMQPKSIPGFAAKLPPCVFAMEACCGAHHLGRLLTENGHEIRLMSPEYVRPYAKAQKNDDRDAEAIAEAATRPTMRFVELKAQEQLDVQSLHRVRSRLVRARTTLINQMRAILLERGTIIPQGRRQFDKALEALLADAGFMAGNRVRRLLLELRKEWIALDRRIDVLDQEFLALARKDATTRRLTSIPGIGALNATALVAAVGDTSSFDKARGLGAWLRGLLTRRHRNTVVVALANKLARIAWATLRRGVTFQPSLAAIPAG